MNKVILIGRLTKDPEVRYTQTGKAVARFTLAVDRRFVRRDADSGQQTADFIPIVVWDKLAEVCGNNLVRAMLNSWIQKMQHRQTEAIHKAHLRRHSRQEAQIPLDRPSLTKKFRFD